MRSIVLPTSKQRGIVARYPLNHLRNRHDKGVRGNLYTLLLLCH